MFKGDLGQFLHLPPELKNLARLALVASALLAAACEGTTSAANMAPPAQPQPTPTPLSFTVQPGTAKELFSLDPAQIQLADQPELEIVNYQSPQTDEIRLLKDGLPIKFQPLLPGYSSNSKGEYTISQDSKTDVITVEYNPDLFKPNP